MPHPSAAAEKAGSHASRQSMTYSVYAGGMHVVSADLAIEAGTANRYNISMGAYTHGLLGRLAPWNGTFETEGWYDPKNRTAKPARHVSKARWRNELETNEYYYNKDGSFKEFIQRNDEKNGVQPAPKELSGNTIDVLTAALRVMNGIDQKNVCQGDSAVFDGDRRFHLIFKDSKSVRLQGNALNFYTGPATECVVEVKPDGGKWRSKPRGWMSIQEQGRKQGTMPTVWFATLTPGQPAVPVKIRVKTDYGTLFMHINSYKSGDRTLSLPQK